MLTFSRLALASIVLTSVSADPNDWINVEYIIQKARQSSNIHPSTIDAQKAIMRSADSSALAGPWSVTYSKNVLPPSGDARDYMSWAPYHWPNCNYCNKAGRTHLSRPDNGTSNTFPDSNRMDPDSSKREWEQNTRDRHELKSTVYFRRMNRVRRTVSNIDPPLASLVSSESEAIIDDPILLPQTPIQRPVGNDLPLLTAPPKTTVMPAKNTPGPAQAVAKTSSKTTCIPSPTKSTAPSATWTTCPYVTRDGLVNPDVRSLNDVGAIISASHAVLLNAIAFIFQELPQHSHNTIRFIDTFFLDPNTRMNPNMDYGQIVRGPGFGGHSGTFAGVLDLRGLVKVANAVMLMKVSGNPDWTPIREQAMTNWLSQYATWLTSSKLGRTTASRPNNHGSFYASQAAAVKILVGDNSGAAEILQRYFTTQFIDQVAKSGEQPFEAVRTRPYHYRCFNLEAMITNAKLGDQLGLNLWSVKSKYGATIQTAADFIMATDPKKEDVTELAPHIASVAAAYGDPTGKYTQFLKKIMPNYQSKPFWLYDQTMALPNSPAATANRRSTLVEDALPPTESIDFECPGIFEDILQEVEIDNGVFVTCEELRQFYEAPFPVST